MAVIILIPALVVFLCLWNELSKKDKEIGKLRKTIEELNQRLKNFENGAYIMPEEKEDVKSINDSVTYMQPKMICSCCGKEVDKRDVSFCKECEELLEREKKANAERIKQLVEENAKAEKAKKEKEDEELKTSMLLVAGSASIILAAIVFLVNGWHYIPDLLKTFTLALGIALFLGGSSIAEKKLKIPKTGRTFFYIAMAYIPIFLLSLSVLGLVGEYFSISGEGKYVYLGFAGVLTALVYFWAYKRKDVKELLYGSLIAQAGSIILFTLVFAEDIKLVLTSLLLYNLILLIILGLKQKSLEIAKEVYYVIPMGALFIGVLLFNFSNSLLLTGIFALLTFNFAGLFLLDRKNKVIPFFINVSLILTGLHIILFNIGLSDIIKQGTAIIYVLLIYLLLMFILRKSKIFVNSIYIVPVVTILYLGLASGELFFGGLVPLFVYSLVVFGMSMLSYIFVSKTVREVLDFIIPGSLIATGLLAFSHYNAVYHFYIIFAIIFFILGEINPMDKKKTIKQVWLVGSHVFLALTYLGVYILDVDKFSSGMLYFTILTVIYAYSLLKEKNNIFKYLAYTSFIIMLQSIGTAFDVEDIVRVVLLLAPSVGIILLENRFKPLQDEISQVFNDVIKVIIFLSLYNVNVEIGIMLAVAYGVFLIIMNRPYLNTPRQYDDVIPLIGIVAVILRCSTLPDEAIIGILGTAAVALSTYSIVQKRISIYTVASGAYLYLMSVYLHSVILSQLLIAIWAFVLWFFMEGEKCKDIFKVILVCACTALYNSIIKELELDEYTVFKFAGFIIADIFLFRTIIKKYVKDSETIEAITLILLYLYPISSYSDEFDGMLFTVLIVVMMVVSFFKKYGSVFLVSTGALLANIFLLTREFWLSLPWWIYLLILGGFLVAFAGTNEARQNKGINISGKIKEFKEMLDGNMPKR